MAQQNRTERGDRQRVSSGQESSGVAEQEREVRPAGDVGVPADTARPHGVRRALTAERPFSLMSRLARDVDELFESFGWPAFGTLARDTSRGSAQSASWVPEIETFRRNGNLVVRADLPGMKREDIELTVSDGFLMLSGERRHEEDVERDGYWRSERSYGRFVRSVPLPEGADENKVSASFRDGVLEVTVPVPRAPERQARRIPVR